MEMPKPKPTGMPMPTPGPVIEVAALGMPMPSPAKIEIIKPDPISGLSLPDTDASFGDKRPAPPTMPTPIREETKEIRRALIPGAKPLPEVQTFKQSGGMKTPLWLSRFPYNGVWITGVANNEDEALDAAEQWYMRETRQGQDDSVMVVE